MDGGAPLLLNRVRVVSGRRAAEKVRCLKVAPELVDGSTYTILEGNIDWGQLGLDIQLWFDEQEPGEKIRFEIVEMTRRELNALPEL